jgi:hypothetical protein
MHPEIERELTTQRIEDLRRAGAPRRRRRAVVPAVSARGESVVIRIAHRADRAALAALAALDGALPPIGGALVAEVKGSIVAALPLGGGRAFADPFRPTMDLIALLEARAEQLERERHPRDERRGVLGWLAPAALRRLV